MLSVKPKLQNAGAAKLSFQSGKERNVSGKVNFARGFAFDTVHFSSKSHSIKTIGKTTNIVSFTGKPRIPTYSLRTPLIEVKRHRSSCKKLAASNWHEGLSLDLNTRKDSLVISHPQYGNLGKITPNIAREINTLIDKGYKINASLSDISGDGTKNHPYQPEVVLRYEIPENKSVRDIPLNVFKTFNKILNDPENSNSVKYYQPALHPASCFDILVPTDTVDNILKEVDKAKNILLIGHKYADGDTIGCVLAMRSALNSVGKDVDCSIDDEIDGLYRHKLPGIDDYLKTPDKLPADKDYDLVMILDTSSPKLIGNHKKFLEKADKVIFIDHHEINRQTWKIEGENVGINLNKVLNDNLLWVRKDLKSAAQMVTAMIFKMLPASKLNNMSVGEKQSIAQPLVAGMATDTLFFNKPDSYKAEGLSKYLMDWGDFDRKWIRDTIKYDLPLPAEEKMENYISKNITIDKESNFASIQIPYEALIDVLNTAKKYDPEVTKTDVINQFKYNEAFQDILYNLQTGEKSRVGAFLIQVSSKKAGDDKDEIAVSFRSPVNTDIACRIAKIFNGGGHSNAAATRIYNHNLKDKCYPMFDSRGGKVTLERKIAKLAASMQNMETDRKMRA